MKLLSWNCQGLVVALTIKNLKECNRKYKPSIVFLMETRMISRKVGIIRRACGLENEMYVEPRGRSGGLAVWWCEGIDMIVLFQSKNLIHVRMCSSVLSVPNFITFVYGAPKDGERDAVWRRLRALARGVEGLWLCVGDFNEVGAQSEKEGGRPVPIRKILKFQQLLDDCGLIDLEFKGSRFTWSNKRLGEDTVKERLDKGFGNCDFRINFSKAQILHMEPIGSDHSLIVVDCCYQEKRVLRTFKFNAMWVEHDQYKSIVANGWRRKWGNIEDKMKDFSERLNRCRKILLEWSKKEFPNNKKVIEELRGKLETCCEGAWTETKAAEAKQVLKRIEEAWDREELFWWQKSRLS